LYQDVWVHDSDGSRRNFVIRSLDRLLWWAQISVPATWEVDRDEGDRSKLCRVIKLLEHNVPWSSWHSLEPKAPDAVNQKSALRQSSGKGSVSPFR
jgi:hypothetical protein